MASEVEIQALTVVEIMRRSAEIARQKKFWLDPATGEDVDFLEAFPLFIALVHSELSEALEEWRRFEPLVPVENLAVSPVATELADAVIRILEFCERAGIPIERAIEAKMAYNARRPELHGKRA